MCVLEFNVRRKQFAYLQVHFFLSIIERMLSGKMFLFPVAPFAEVIPQTVTVIEGGNITLVCNISGVPAPSILWTQIGSSKVVSHNSSLTIVNVSRPAKPAVLDTNLLANLPFGQPGLCFWLPLYFFACPLSKEPLPIRTQRRSANKIVILLYKFEL